MPPKRAIDHALGAVARDFGRRGYIMSGLVVPDRARGEFHRRCRRCRTGRRGSSSGFCVSSANPCPPAACEKGLWLKMIWPVSSSSFIFKIREIGQPSRNLNTPFSSKSSSIAQIACARLSGKLRRLQARATRRRRTRLSPAMQVRGARRGLSSASARERNFTSVARRTSRGSSLPLVPLYCDVSRGRCAPSAISRPFDLCLSKKLRGFSAHPRRRDGAHARRRTLRSLY